MIRQTQHITDDDTATMSINDVTVTEGNSGTSTATFTVTLSTPSSSLVSANYAFVDGTAVRGSDYTTNGSVLVSLSPGQTILTITQGNGVYVTANFKETQIGSVRVGQPAEIEVDAFPGKGGPEAVPGSRRAQTHRTRVSAEPDIVISAGSSSSTSRMPR